MSTAWQASATGRAGSPQNDAVGLLTPCAYSSRLWWHQPACIHCLGSFSGCLYLASLSLAPINAHARDLTTVRWAMVASEKTETTHRFTTRFVSVPLLFIFSQCNQNVFPEFQALRSKVSPPGVHVIIMHLSQHTAMCSQSVFPEFRVLQTKFPHQECN